MPAYSYDAVNAQGTAVSGAVEADSPRSARLALRAQGLVPVRVDEVADGRSGSAPDWLDRLGEFGVLLRPFTARAFNPGQRAVLVRQLASLIGSGLPVERALAVLMDDLVNLRQRRVLAAVKAEVNAGAPLAAALQAFPHDFPEVDRAAIAAGEQGGDLGLVLSRLADDLEASQQLRSKVMGAAAYPLMVCLVATVIVGFLVTSVVPQVAGVFAGGTRQLPALTSAMLALSRFVSDWGWTLPVVLLAAVWTTRKALKREGVAERVDAAWLRLPILGRMARDYNAARFAGTLAMLNGAGVPILKALLAAQLTLSNRAMRGDVGRCIDEVREGVPLSRAIAREGRFPLLVPTFIRLGEQTGDMSGMLDRAARQLGNEVQRRAMAIAAIAEPALIVVMGLVVMVIVLAVLLPIMELNKWVR